MSLGPVSYISFRNDEVLTQLPCLRCESCRRLDSLQLPKPSRSVNLAFQFLNTSMHTCVCPSNDPSPHPTPPSSSVILTNSHLGGTRKYSTDLIFAISVIALVVDFNYNLCLRMVTVERELNLIKVGIAFDSGGIAPIGAMSLRCVADHNTRQYPKNPRKVLSSCFCGSHT